MRMLCKKIKRLKKEVEREEIRRGLSSGRLLE